MKGETDVDMSTGNFTTEGKLYDAEEKAQNGNMSLDNSLKLGISGTIGPAEGEAGVNLYQLGKATALYAKAGVEYLSEKVSELWPFN